MTGVDHTNTSASAAEPDYGTSIDYDGARVRVFPHSQAMLLIAISGDIDASNAERVSGYVRRFVRASRPVVLDMTDVNVLPASGIRNLLLFGDERADAGGCWVLVTNHRLHRILRVTVGDDALPVETSLTAALQRLSPPRAHRENPCGSSDS